MPRHFDKHVHGSAAKILTEAECENDPLGFAYKLLEIHDGHSVVGCKVFLGHSPSAHSALVSDPSIQKIFLRRENLLAAHSSRRIAMASGVWNSTTKKDLADYKIPFEPRPFRKFISSTTEYFAALAEQSKGPVLNLTYADHVMKKDTNALFDFLGLTVDEGVTSGLKKQLDSNMLPRLEDPKQVADFFAKIGHPEWENESYAFSRTN